MEQCKLESEDMVLVGEGDAFDVVSRNQPWCTDIDGIHRNAPSY
jgi:hypothetical protein